MKAIGQMSVSVIVMVTEKQQMVELSPAILTTNTRGVTQTRGRGVLARPSSLLELSEKQGENIW